jgi:transcriptional regulator with XRE-family HTH domain
MPRSSAFTIDSLPERLLRLREKCGWSQFDLAGRIGVSRSFVALIENGKRLPSMATLRKIVDACKEKVSEGIVLKILWGSAPVDGGGKHRT